MQWVVEFVKGRPEQEQMDEAIKKYHQKYLIN